VTFAKHKEGTDDALLPGVHEMKRLEKIGSIVVLVYRGSAMSSNDFGFAPRDFQLGFGDLLRFMKSH